MESRYEYGRMGGDDKTYAHADSPEEVALRIGQTQMAGCYNAWDVVRPADTPPGYRYLKYFKAFFTGTRYWLLKPADSLVSTGYCLANAGKKYVVFQGKASTFTLNLSSIGKPMKATWYHPYTGEYDDAGLVKKGRIALTPPPALGNGPIVLHLTAVSD